MRVLVEVRWDTQSGNEAIKSGTIREQIEHLNTLATEGSLYFTLRDGKRTAFAVCDLRDESQLPAIAEPLFMGGNATITVTPCMTRDEVMKGLKDAHLT